jgi:hypothetical protein
MEWQCVHCKEWQRDDSHRIVVPCYNPDGSRICDKCIFIVYVLEVMKW